MYIANARQTICALYNTVVIGKIWRYSTGKVGHVLPVRANRIEKSDADFAPFARVTRPCIVSRDNSENVKRDTRAKINSWVNTQYEM